jgi:Fur family peroxide stress response transcriptional regulator
MTTFKTMLQSHALKATHQRLAILEEIDKHGHIDVDTLFASLHERFPTLALGTLYRNLGELSQKNILAEVVLPGQKQKYEILKAPHVHLVCEVCGKVEDKALDLSSVIAQVEAQSRYKINSNAVTFSGVCEACRKKARKEAQEDSA